MLASLNQINRLPSPVDAEGSEAPESQDVDPLRTLGPWALSATVHLALVLLAIFAVWLQSKRLMEAEPPITPTIATSHRASVLTWSKRSVTSGTVYYPGPLSPTESKDSVLSQKPIRPNKLIGAFMGSNAGAISFDDSGPASQLRPNDLFSQTHIHAKRIVYLIDGSGSLIDTMPFVLSELKRSIAGLSPGQRFTVLFFQHDRVLEIPPLGLKPATPKNRTAAVRWLSQGHVVPRGSVDPLAGIRRALGYRPQLVFLLSDNITGKGRWEMDQGTFLAEVRRANNNAAKFNTIQFLYEDPLVAVGKGRTLQKLSRATGGVFKFANARELGLE